jgi:hypothetical protein
MLSEMLNRVVLVGLTSLSLGVSLSVFLSSQAPAQAIVLYKSDTLDENPTSRLFPVGLEPMPDYPGTIVGDLMWLNAYKVQTGGEILQSIALTWGPSASAQGSPISLLLYRDPNNDGNPNDAQLLTQAETQVSNPDGRQFTTVNLQPTTFNVGQTFFVGALLRNLRRDQRPATADLAGTVPGTSWFAIGNHGDGEPSNIDINHLANNFRSGSASQSPLPLPTMYGNWVLRVTGDDARRRVPESDGVVGLGVVSLLAWRLLTGRRRG